MSADHATVPDLRDLVPPSPRFRTHAETLPDLLAASESAPHAEAHRIGQSEEGRPLVAFEIGDGPRLVSLMAGAHADEPVGPETLRILAAALLRQPERFAGLLGAFRLLIVPHINPDGEARNRRWVEAWPSLEAFAREVDREPPGRDVEFGYPDLRPENAAWSRFVRERTQERGPLALHASLHGMAFSTGALLLVERHWAGERTRALRDAFAEAARSDGFELHNHNRRGEKGFFYIERGFTTTPEGQAMQDHFRALGDEAMASRFRLSSMEYARHVSCKAGARPGTDTLCLVTEMPLFLVDADPASPPGTPLAYLHWKERLADWDRGDSARLRELAGTFGVRPVPLRAALRMHFWTLMLGLRRVL
jgi:hypothetical protein